MTRFIAGLVLGGVMVGACWFSNRLAYYQLRNDMLEVHELASHLRAMQPDPKRDDGRPDEVWANNPRGDVTYAARGEEDEGSEIVAVEPCVLASFPPKPCSELGKRKSAEPKSRPYRLGAQRRKWRRYDPDGTWVDLPKPEISPTDRAELVKALEARGGKDALAGG